MKPMLPLLSKVLSIAALLTIAMAPAQASAALWVECWGTVTTAGNGQWVRNAPTLSGAPLYQLVGGQEVNFLQRTGGTADGIVWRAQPNHLGQPSNQFVPIRTVDGSGMFVERMICDHGN